LDGGGEESWRLRDWKGKIAGRFLEAAASASLSAADNRSALRKGARSWDENDSVSKKREQRVRGKSVMGDG
jgi:hypothetical protein